MGKKRDRTRRKKKKRSYRPRERSVPQELQQAETYYNKGIDALDMEAYRAAEQYFQESLDLFVTPDAYYGLGSVYMSQERYEEAIEPFEKATKLDRKNCLYWYSLGAATLREAYLYRAATAFEKAEKYDPHDDPELTESIDYHFNLLEEAIKAQLEEHPGLDRQTYLQQEARYFRAVDLQSEGKIEEALPLFLEYLKIEPDYYRALGNAAVCLLGLKRLDEAEPLLRRALQVNPDYELARHNLKMLRRLRQENIPSEEIRMVEVDTEKEEGLEEQLFMHQLKDMGNLSPALPDINQDDEEYGVRKNRSRYKARSRAKGLSKDEQSMLKRMLSRLGF